MSLFWSSQVWIIIENKGVYLGIRIECEFMRQFWGKSTIWGRNEHANRPSCQLRETGT